ncbi:hypothetical protein AB0H76_22265 [Nocardia sp. NPDC050712]|uniref:hypothetical protein n=1 Tax=Nocardia sp. NPDC050712 TaxID=3155518 RepID=UPI0033CF957B
MGSFEYWPPHSLPSGWHRFTLFHCPLGQWDIRFEDARYEAIKGDPPEGCTVTELGRYFALECERPGPTFLDAVATTCAHIRDRYGLPMYDLGIENVDEWSSDGLNGWGAKVLGQLALMSVERTNLLGYHTEDLVRFIRTVSHRVED